MLLWASKVIFQAWDGGKILAFRGGRWHKGGGALPRGQLPKGVETFFSERKKNDPFFKYLQDTIFFCKNDFLKGSNFLDDKILI